MQGSAWEAEEGLDGWAGFEHPAGVRGLVGLVTGAAEPPPATQGDPFGVSEECGGVHGKAEE